MHFETLFFFFFSVEMGLTPPAPPLKCGKFHTFFLNPSLREGFKKKIKKNYGKFHIGGGGGGSAGYIFHIQFFLFFLLQMV